MDFTGQLYSSISQRNAFEVLDHLNILKSHHALGQINMEFLARYGITFHEALIEYFSEDEFLAISLTVDFIRKPNDSSSSLRNGFYRKIGYNQPMFTGVSQE